MRISLLLEREPLPEIFAETMARFLAELHARPFRVVWKSGRGAAAAVRREGFSPWLVNSRVNAIFSPRAEAHIFDPLRREFGRSVRRFRGPLQRGYVTLATRRPMSRWLADAAVGFLPDIPDAEQKLIVAGNHKIRLLHAAANRVYAVAKQGTSPLFLERELAAHAAAERLGIRAPRIVEIAADRRWFVQEFVAATPQNRLADAALAATALREGTAAVRRLVTETLREELVELEGLRVVGE